AGFVLTQLSSVDQRQYPWVSVVSIIAGACLFVAMVVFVLFVFLRQVKSASRSRNSPASSRRTRYDSSSDSWFNMARLAAAASAALTILTAAILLLVPPPGLCPNWHLPDRASTPLWGMFAFWTLPTLAFQVFIIVRWNWAVQKMIDESADYPTTA